MADLAKKIANLPISLFGRFLYYCIPYRRKVILANINLVFGNTLTKAKKKHLAMAFYSHLATSIKEFWQLRFLNEEELRQRVEVRGHQRLLDIIADKRGVLILTGHFGNWEFAPLGGVLQFKQFTGQFHFIRRTLGNKTLERLLFGRYRRSGLNVIPKKNSLAQVCEALEQNHAVIFVLDQHASLRNRDGIAVEFFGKPAGTYRSLASIARYTGVPVVPASSFRLADGRHVLEFHKAITWQEMENTQDSIYHNTRLYNQALERIILEHPEQWHWLHRRWKL